MERIIKSINNVWIEFQNSVIDHIPKLILAILVILIFALIANTIKNLCLRVYKKVFKNHYLNIERILASTFYVLFFALGIFLALNILGLEKPLEKLLAGAGIVSIVAGFAFKDIASNVFSGLLVDLQRPYNIGDWVEIDGNYGDGCRHQLAYHQGKNRARARGFYSQSDYLQWHLYKLFNMGEATNHFKKWCVLWR
ncbi:mechanosensitive ion channel domain-containing protein [Zhouia amylolytica]|uniref:Mechanosensitive ion channel MscS domain-containing protein n=1 Tax=Zhouia amylolytica AD3 TaxID=1286632 RepID=W2URQ4_9FLAO|nr:mechanosensitive ion channel domain-containing protein [Zhouia amylolytica]ETN96634.1 hypothetical protein P278_00600 [Zhouia amylolytica AD3]